MKKSIFILSLMLLLGAVGARAAEAYAYFDPSDGSLNFCYDNSKSTRAKAYTVYSLNTGSNTPAWNAIASQVKELYFYQGFANYRPTTCYMWASDMTNLTKVTLIKYLNTSYVTNMAMMFCSCSKLTSLDVSGFNTSNVTNMKAMFENCSGLKTLAVDNWDTSKVTNMAGLFYGCSGLTSLNVGNWNTSKVTTMRYLFYKCSSLTSLNVSNWNTKFVTTFYYMFGNCSNLQTITGLTSMVLGTQNFVFTSSATTVEGMFCDCKSLNQLWLLTSYINSTTTTNNMFKNCSGLQYLSLSNSLCSYLNSSACSGVGTTSSPCHLNYPQDTHPTWTTITPDYVTWNSGYFKSMSMKAYANLQDNILYFYYDDYSATRSGTVYDLNTGSNRPGWYEKRSSITRVIVNSKFTNARPTSCYEWFSGMSNLDSYEGFDCINTSEVTNMAYMFKDCSKLAYISIAWKNFNTSKVTSMAYMFYGCSNLAALSLGTFNTSNVTDFGYMFHGCSRLSGIDVSKFDTSKATYMAAMFKNCSRMTSINVSSFNTANATSWMAEMFSGCSKLTSLDLSSFTIGSTNYMLENCTSLTYLKVPATGNNLTSTACTGVGTAGKPCLLDHPDGFTPTGAVQGDGYFKWKSGYFKDILRPYAVLNGSTLTFYYDKNSQKRTGTVYDLKDSGFDPPEWYESHNYVTNVVFNSSFANARPISCYFWFASMINLTKITGLNYLNTSETKYLDGMFYDCKKLTSLDLRSFNTQNVLSMESMFSSCQSATSIDVSNFNTSKVVNMRYMFSDCSSLTSLDLSKFNTENVTDMYGMFRNCKKLTSLDLSNIQMAYTREDGPVVEEIIVHCDGWLVGCSSLQTLTLPKNIVLEVGSDWDPDTGEPVTLTSDLNANLLQEDAFTGVGSPTNPCKLIFSGDFKPWVHANDYGDGWFKYKGGYFLLDEPKAYAKLLGNKLIFYYDGKSSLSAAYTFDLNSGSNTPSWNAHASDVTTVIFDESFAEASPTSCYQWFYNMNKLKNVEGVEYLNTSSVTNMASMFEGCSNLEKLELCFEDDWETSEDESEKSLDTRNVTTMASMFQGCSKLANLYLGTFNTAKVTNMSNMFYGCTSLKNLTLYSEMSMSPSGERDFETEFVTSKATNMKQMFYNCKSLTDLDFPGLSLTSKTTTTDMFKNCSAISSFYVANDLSNAPAKTFAGIGSSSKPCKLESKVLPADAEYTPTYFLWKGGYFIDAIRVAFAVFDTNTLTFYYDNDEGATMIGGDSYEVYHLDNTMTTPGWSSVATKITKVEFDGNFKYVRPATCQNWFNGMTNLTSITGIGNLNTSYVTNMAYMFQNCKKLQDLDISGFTLSSSTTTTAMLKTCSALKSLTIPATAEAINSSACSGVGTKTSPCTLIYPAGFTPEKTSTGSGWYMWKGGYFKDEASGIMGDANGDGDVSVADVLITVDYVLGKNPAGFIFANANVNGDKDVTIADVTAIVDLVLNQKSAPAVANARESVADAISIFAKGGRATVVLDNSEPFKALQFRVAMPEGAEMGNAALEPARSNGHQVLTHCVAPGIYNVVVYGNSSTDLRDGSLPLLRFDYAGCQPGDISIEDVQLVNGQYETVVPTGILTGISIAEIGGEDSDDQPYYNTVGIGTNTPTRGVYIRNGKKVVVK